MNKGLPIEIVLKDFDEILNNIQTIITYDKHIDIRILKSECYRLKYNDIAKKINQKNIESVKIKGKKFLKLDKNPVLSELYKLLFKKDIKLSNRCLCDIDIIRKCYFKINNIKPIEGDV